MAASALHHEILIIGAGSDIAARLRRAKASDVALIDPAETHYHQSLRTPVGAGVATAFAWIKEAATGIDPDGRVVTTAAGVRVSYDQLVVCPGIQLDCTRSPA